MDLLLTRHYGDIGLAAWHRSCKMINIYTDTGEHTKGLAVLRDSGLIKIITADTLGDDKEATPLFSAIQNIVGPSNLQDARHVDTACREACAAFITSDIDDILSKKWKLEELTQMRFFHRVLDWQEFVAWLDSKKLSPP